MALFSTPSLLDLIWRRDIYPEQGGDMGAGMIGGFAGMLGGIGGGKPKAPAPSKSTKNWGTVGQSPTAETPGAPQQSGGGGGGSRQPDIPSTMAPAVNTPTVPQAGGVTSMLSGPGMEMIRRALYGITG
jgi:hypothetical protein